MDVSNAAKRLRYSFAGPEAEREECERAYWIKSSLDGNTSGTLHFVVPPDPEAFTDVNATYLSVNFQVFKADGKALEATDKVFVTPGSLQGLFSSCQIFLNGDSLDPNNVYSWGATLTSYLGTSKTAREDVWSQLAGMNPPLINSSFLTPRSIGPFGDEVKRIAGSKQATFTGRLMSDFMQSCAQLLLPNIKLEVSLRRSPDAFALCSCSEDPSLRYQLVINNASLFVRRVRMSKPVLEKTLLSVGNGCRLAYTRMDCVINQIPARGVSYRCSNIYGGGKLPHTLYFVVANQMAFPGSQNYLGNYFESGCVRSLQVFENGRPVLTQPITTNYIYKPDGSLDNDSDASEPFLSMAQAMNGIADSHISAGMNYRTFKNGCIVTCVQLNSCGGKKTSPGFLDVELVLDEPETRQPMLLLCFGEFDRVINLDKNLHIAPN